MGNIIQLDATSAAGDANTDFVIPAYGKYKVLYGHVALTTDATVANRRVIFRILDDTGTPVKIFDSHAGAVVTASSTDQHHELMQGIYRETAFLGNALQIPIPQDCFLDEGWTLRILVEAGVAGDSYDTHIVAEDYGHRRYSK